MSISPVLGSIEMPLTVANRVAFLQRVHERLAKLSNRIDLATHGQDSGRHSQPDSDGDA
jgi:hypothetical protein